MKPITPIVGISKIINAYQTFVCGVDGVLNKGGEMLQEPLKALQSVHESGKEVVLFSNSPMRVWQVASALKEAGFDLRALKAVITAGEILHYKLKNNHTLGKKYYNLGGDLSKEILTSLPYVPTNTIHEADFLFIGDIDEQKPNVEDYETDLQTAAALHLPLVCCGTDVAAHLNGEVALSAGGVAEQYAVMGGDIITVSKTDADVLAYLKESISNTQKILLAGDSFASDMKAASLLGADALLISKGIHKHALGEGYIPDVQKARDLAMNYNIYPGYVISELRF